MDRLGCDGQVAGVARSGVAQREIRVQVDGVKARVAVDDNCCDEATSTAVDVDRVVARPGADGEGCRRVGECDRLTGSGTDCRLTSSARVGDGDRLGTSIEREQAIEGGHGVENRFKTGVDNRRSRCTVIEHRPVMRVAENMFDRGRCAAE